MKDKALSRKTDPWSSQEVVEYTVFPDLLDAIQSWMAAGKVMSCGKACGYASDFEITTALLPFFPEVYEGEIRRQMRRLRQDDCVFTAPKWAHKHRNPDTGKIQQCHYLGPRRRFIPRQ